MTAVTVGPRCKRCGKVLDRDVIYFQARQNRGAAQAHSEICVECVGDLLLGDGAFLEKFADKILKAMKKPAASAKPAGSG